MGEGGLSALAPTGATDLGSARPRRVAPTNPYAEFPECDLEQSIPDRFEQQVRLHGPKLALRSDRHALSYEALNRLANRVARAILARRGEGPEPVGLLFEHDAPLIAAMLGVLKAGKFYVPLDPLYPRERTVAMLAASEAKLLLTDGAMLALATELAGDQQEILDLDRILPDSSDENPGLEIRPDAFAYILFTSGSTGQPKGVVEDHRHLLHFTRSFTNACHVSPDDRLPLLVSCCFSASASSIYGSLLNGASLHLLDLRAAGLGQLASWLVREEITLLWGSTFFSTFVRTLSGRERFPRLRLIHVGGQTLVRRDLELYQRFFADDCLLVNVLGATEKKTVCRYFVDKQTVLEGEIVPVGYPIEDTEIVLVDDDERPVAVGEVGEITVKSRYFVPGFWREPELTRATLRPVPGGSGERIWYSGDLGRMGPDGCLVHLGRKDSRVKIRGYSVELAEVEAALLGAPGVADGVVVAPEVEVGRRRLVAYYIPAAGSTPTVTELRSFFRAKLPAYMMPSAFIPLAALPRNPNGKVDRQNLPAPDRSRPNLAGPYVPPRTEAEAELAEIWEDLLGVRPIGVRDDFFELGGDSLAAVSMLAAVEERFGRSLPDSSLLPEATVEHVAAALSGDDPSAAAGSVVLVQRGGARSSLVFVQWFGGGGIEFTNLARRLGQDRDFFGVEIPARDPHGRPWPDLGRLASHLVGELRSVQAEGPYILGGYSSGATVAFEMACQLIRAGQAVPLLVVLDAAAPLSLIRRTWQRPGAWAGLVEHVLERGLGRLTARSSWRDLGRYARHRTAVLVGALGLPVARVAGPRPAGDRRRQQPDDAAPEQFSWVLKTYRVGPYPGRIAVFRGTERHRWRHDPTLGWGALAAGGAEVWPISGRHLEILREPHLAVLADRLRQALERLDP